MKRRNLTAIALCSTLLAATATFVPTVQAGNVAWGVSVGGPGFTVAAGQPGWSGGRVWFGPPVRPFAPVVFRPWVRPWPIVAPIAFAPRRVIVVRQPVRFAAPAVVYWR